MLLEVKNVEYTYFQKGKLFAKDRQFHLGPVSFNMQQGETIAIVGNNGSGKSLLAKLLAGAINPEAGEIIIADTEDGRKRHNTIRMILQHSADALNPALSVGSILHQTLRLNSDLKEEARREKIEDTLVKVGLLREHYHFYRHMLSDGQQQRVALARALILDPEIIVADEPFAALDPSVRSQTVNLILQLQADLGLGFVFISHNIGIVRHISDRVLIMDKGVIIEQGKTEAVFSNPRTLLTQKLVQAHMSLVDKHFDQKNA
ncbi:ATP-binding cassette domain-containing protein [Agaribacter flavus]|uniref:ATP-binding cassette domain-containing protein n=1 Tax=Agaribacter flavus TaxID=1902781 RepID=A0ABV7FM94_9ALTE